MPCSRTSRYSSTWQNCLASVVFLRLFIWFKVSFVSWNPLPIRTFNFMISWGMVSDKVIDVSADWILRVQRFFSPSRLLQQKAMITIENDIVAVDILVRLRFLPIDRKWSPLVSHFFIRRTSERATIRAGSKMECVELYFISAAHAFYCQAIKKIRIFWCEQSYSSTKFWDK